MNVPTMKAAEVGSSVSSIVGKLRFLTGGINASFRVNCPPLPEFPSLGSVKEFCSGLLEQPNSHPWVSWWTALPQGKRFSIAHSLFLFRKVVPFTGNPETLAESYIRKMSQPGSKADADLLRFVEKEIPRIFPRGWDCGYRRKAGQLLLPVKACLKAGRRAGGARSLSSDLPFLRRCALGWEVCRDHKNAKATVVFDGGKPRVVTITSHTQNILKPLHEVLYDQLSKQSWLLRGDAEAKCFNNFSLKKGEIFVSGDYEAATDNISLELSRKVLDTIRKCSQNIPGSVWDFARDRTTCDLFAGRSKTTFPQRRGQLMGNFLSFPLLCLINYLVFKWAVPRKGVPVKINGDDIVFRATEEEKARWFEKVEGSGLILSKGKTLVNEGVFTLNSTLFAGKKEGARALPFIRSKALFTKCPRPSSLAGQFKSLCPGISDGRRSLFQVYFLKHNRDLIRLCRRSLRRGLGLRVRESVIRQAGLLRWERWYSAALTEEPLPVYCDPDTAQTQFPPGFRSFRRSQVHSKGTWNGLRLLSGSFHLACRLYAESAPNVFRKEDFRETLHRGTVPMLELKPSLRLAFNRIWAKLARKPVLGSVPRVEERLMLPAAEEREGKRCGLGFVALPEMEGY
nr:MAG: RNA-dependent RNA polymerase [Botourmiaviridae sp.]